MSTYIYLSVMPEALIASMLPPAEFGAYQSTGTKKSNRSQAMFFEVDAALVRELIDEAYLGTRCVAKPDGKPKSSVYLSVYRVLESIPLSALKDLYLTTDHGIVLGLKKSRYERGREKKRDLHLYQELCPVHPQVASSLSPPEFIRTLTDGSIQIRLPKLFMADLKLGDLAENPLSGSAEHIPFEIAPHLRDCLEILKTEEGKKMKTVQRSCTGSLLYRSIENGFYMGAGEEVWFYRFPSMAEMESLNYEFFRAL